MSETLLDRWGISAIDLGEIVHANPSLRGILSGYVAEFKLRKLWFSSDKVSHVLKHDDHDRRHKSDLVIVYRGEEFSVELKSLQTNTVMRAEEGCTGTFQCDASDRRKVVLPSGRRMETTCLVVGGFDVLAVNLYEFHQEWKFAFAKNSDLPRSSFKKYTAAQRQYLLATLIDITWPLAPPFRSDPFGILDELIEERRHAKARR